MLYEASGVPREEWRELLEFAAIATVGDVMRLQDENRILVKYGLKQMARIPGTLGLRKLVEKTGLDITDLSAYHIGFVIGPCLNAGGRLQTAKAALRLFLSEDEAEAEQLAEELKELNDVRKDMIEKRRGRSHCPCGGAVHGRQGTGCLSAGLSRIPAGICGPGP